MESIDLTQDDEPEQQPIASTSKLISTSSPSTNTNTRRDELVQVPIDVISDLDRLISFLEGTKEDAHTTIDEIWSETLHSSLEWILSLEPRSDSLENERGNTKGKAKDDDPSRLIHWYCGTNGAESCWRSSVFLIGLMSKKLIDQVAIWRRAFERLMLECPNCVTAYQHAKEEFLTRYLSRYKTETAVRVFSDAIERIEKQRVLSTFEANADVPLSSLPLATIQNCLVNPLLFQDRTVMDLFISRLPITSVLDLPRQVTPGLIALRFHQSAALRSFVQMQLESCQVVESSQFLHRGLKRIFESHLDLLTSRDRNDPCAETKLELPYLDSKFEFWRALTSSLNVLDSQTIQDHLTRSKGTEFDLFQIVTSHLGDQQDHLYDVLNCFRIILDRLGHHVWERVGDRFEEVVLHSILDNPKFDQIFTSERETIDTTSSLGEESILNWIPPFLASVSIFSTRFNNSMAIISSTFLARLQAIRFDIDVRTRALIISISLFSDVFLSTPSSPSSPSTSLNETKSKWPHSAEANKVLDLHAPTLVDFAFDPVYSAEKWKLASSRAREFVGRIMARDSRIVRETTLELGRVDSNLKDERDRNKKLKKEGQVVPISTIKIPKNVTICSTLWKRLYDVFTSTDAVGLVTIVHGIGPVIHLQPLSSRSWEFKDSIRPQMKTINSALDSIRNRFVPFVESFSDEAPDVLIDLLSQPDMVEQFTMWLLSPVESIQNVAQGLIKQTFDVITRRDCFGALLLHFPNATIKGLLRSIRTFTISAKSLPEVCGHAKRLVRCLSDVIDALCGASNGLLRDLSFERTCSDSGIHLGSRLNELWKRMCEALSIVFKHTPSWSNYYESTEMTEWMRDAIMFGVDLLAEQHTFETAISKTIDQSNPNKSPKKSLSKSSLSIKMIAALSEPLEELTSWLRLNDEELLESTFDLVRKMLNRFAEARVELRSSTVAKLRKITDSNRRNSNNRSNILRDDQLSQLVEALAAREEEEGEEEVMIVEPSPSLKQSKLVVDKSRSARPTTSSSQAQNLMRLPPRPGSMFPNRLKPALPPTKVAARPRGVPWTTYTSKPTRAFSSSEESSSDDEDETGSGVDKKPSGLAALARIQKGSPKIKRISTNERRTVKMLGDPSSTNNGRVRGNFLISSGDAAREAAQLRAANQAKLRGPQDYSALYRRILQWDIEIDTVTPPHLSVGGLKRLKPSFKTFDEYFECFEPLLLTECWEQIRNSVTELGKEVQSRPIKTTIAGRQAVDDFVDLFVTIEHGDLPQGAYMFDTDLVLLKEGKHQLLAKVQAFARKRTFFEATLRVHLGSDKTDAGPGLIARSQWQMVKLYSLSTIHREYSALQSMRHLDLFADIVDPRPAPPIPFDTRTLARIASTYQVNEPQAKAIQGALQTSGFSLIQGPPGTGKTKTILGLIGAFIDSRAAPAVPITVGQSTSSREPDPVPKVLLCAPSNAAVDEVAKRLKDGIRDSKGKIFVPKVVRIGSDSAVDISVKDIFLDELVERALSGNVGNGTTESADASQAKMQSMRAEIDVLRAERDEKLAQIENVENNNSLRDELRYKLKTVKAQIFELSQRLDAEKDKAQQSKRSIDAQQRKMRNQILSEADVICATLSGSGHDYMAQLPFDFETVIIDEAAQSVELSSLIPLRYGCRRCIMVGDPLQLPPTVISGAAKNAGYETSLFVRLMEQGRGSHLLSIQYRMHPHISAFPSAAFYQRRLLDGEDLDKKTAQPWHASSLFPPYSFFHIRNGTEVLGRHHSWTNPQEAQTALAIYERMLREYPSINLDYRIGIVTPYKAQVWELKSTFRRRFGDDIWSKIAFNTVDGFQGQEKDLIILSCVRGGSADKGVGFLADTRRMNVALTRARSSLFILGDSKKLRSNKYWANLVEDAEARGLLTHVDPDYYRSSRSTAPPMVKTASGSASTSIAKPIVNPSAGVTAVPVRLKGATGQKTGSAAATSPVPPAPATSSTSGVKRRLADVTQSRPLKKSTETVVGASVVTAVKAEVKPLLSINGGSTPPASAALTVASSRPKPKPSMFITKKRPIPGPSAKKP